MEMIRYLVSSFFCIASQSAMTCSENWSLNIEVSGLYHGRKTMFCLQALKVEGGHCLYCDGEDWRRLAKGQFRATVFHCFLYIQERPDTRRDASPCTSAFSTNRVLQSKSLQPMILDTVMSLICSTNFWGSITSLSIRWQQPCHHIAGCRCLDDDALLHSYLYMYSYVLVNSSPPNNPCYKRPIEILDLLRSSDCSFALHLSSVKRDAEMANDSWHTLLIRPLFLVS